MYDQKRLGKVKRLNQLYSRSTSDIFVQFDADIQVKDMNLINKLIRSFIRRPDTEVVFGMQQPIKTNTLVGSLAYFGFQTWEKVKHYSMKNVERYNCFGQITAFSKKFLSEYRIPENKYITEDTYSFYFAKLKGKSTYFCKEAKVFFKLPHSIADYTHQMSRYISTESGMESLFGQGMVLKYETLTTSDKIQGLFRNIRFSNIHIAIMYVALQIITRIQNKLSKQKVEWVTITSSK
jgi:cellulose synthase/poly-beta-1,6-N-acetylglucosamine synthase-like glycosyltransferase